MFGLLIFPWNLLFVLYISAVFLQRNTDVYTKNIVDGIGTVNLGFHVRFLIYQVLYKMEMWLYLEGNVCLVQNRHGSYISTFVKPKHKQKENEHSVDICIRTVMFFTFVFYNGHVVTFDFIMCSCT